MSILPSSSTKSTCFLKWAFSVIRNIDIEKLLTQCSIREGSSKKEEGYQCSSATDDLNIPEVIPSRVIFMVPSSSPDNCTGACVDVFMDDEKARKPPCAVYASKAGVKG